jgi:hypothetical protein
MKNFCKFLFMSACVAGSVFSSCTKDNETTTQPLTRGDLTGTWLVNDSQLKQTYEATIVIDSASSTGVRIGNFAGAGPSVYAIAYLSGNTLSLNNNELLSNGWIVNGSGTVSGTTGIDWPYTLHDGANLTSNRAVFTKK